MTHLATVRARAALPIRGLALALLCVTLTARGAAPFEFMPGPPEDEAAVAAQASEVLRQIDAGNAGAAWDGASPMLRQRTPRPAFVAALASMRGAMGDLQSRKREAIGFVTDMPDAPPGRYAGAFFESTFARETVEEKAVFVRQGDAWRLVGYFMSKRYTVRPGAPGAAGQKAAAGT